MAAMKRIPTTKEICIVNSTGQVIGKACPHPKIPGLDADFCRECQTWFFNAQMREQVLKKRTICNARSDGSHHDLGD